jgi:hypothetical protein
MTNWHLNKEGIIINSIVAETKEIAQELYPDCEIIEDPGYMGPGWTETADGWRPAYPDDGETYEWSELYHEWKLPIPVMDSEE